ncbi:acetylornithine/succinyldiaminopimelate/putrescine aminotransferase [Aquimarina sp. EL_43]|uniref:aspartate aminotransferase family protein n=1 Tax=unclassified Aquimarina TaxID=2627091 RepID=UPI0018C92DD4|nr:MULTISPECIES: aspartate aminotransferase family protein [unclassified Aquimarina]MBG6132310.1 acetylornithine/succinyldiaminopimelate/putrescine aminotransferase [Aquimarina sp. EL_35]MBG6152441.1 acetylornithine/succinyldiaminopimelate/putrescine aminotransferase [Aquimarina sp. EL_32]MBG6170632.1 acetylornithine/succinyldiaminopimelate/putrescine aminotransferase [Aquimarina sp. EL_43]
MKQDFFKYQAQTTPHPLAIEVSYATGSYIYDTNNKKYLDFVAGVSACSLGHKHPRVIRAVKNQLDKYLHVMVYGEYIQQPAVELTKLLASHLPHPLEKTYLTNSGTEAIEGALKLARRVTGRSQIIAAKLAYHGNTMGSMSVMGYEERKQAFRPLIPDTSFITFNDEKEIQQITHKTAAVILETIQGGAGFIEPKYKYLKKVKKKCQEVGALLILDEIQPGFGRTGTLFGFQHYGIVPDIVVMGKGMGGGLPIGAFTASTTMMDQLQDNPKLGHITTFGGNPVIAAAALATLQEITESDVMAATLEKEKLFRSLLVHPLIKEIRGLGLMLAFITPSAEITNQVILKCQDHGLILFWLLFEPLAVRITPPLTISESEIREGCQIILTALDQILDNKI